MCGRDGVSLLTASSRHSIDVAFRSPPHGLAFVLHQDFADISVQSSSLELVHDLALGEVCLNGIASKYRCKVALERRLPCGWHEQRLAKAAAVSLI